LGEAAERAQRGTSEHPRPEAVGDGNQEQVPTRREDDQNRDADDTGDDPGGLLVAGSGKENSFREEARMLNSLLRRYGLPGIEMAGSGLIPSGAA
jgi:hypothetical protein